VTAEPKKYAAVPAAKKDVLTVVKITRLAARGQTIRDFLFTLMARLDAPSNDWISIAYVNSSELALRLR
jgi:hypothetical protein